MKTTTEASMAAASFVGDEAGQAQDVAKESLHNAAAKASKAGDAVSGKAGEAMNGIKDMAMSTGDKASSE
ncbi:expressed unknown protein [Seminavis robusta]|uniref:Uncharacterized protein n=1 Tax=Seminavis robusta TaxID=568900 RepID=A0A9N8EYC0_9STRA|nr:expressed unknown protein [Seminavis robusta]|eukprot:Sro2077_g313620.1 n/a (70) ;mRNA; f:17681-17890